MNRYMFPIIIFSALILALSANASDIETSLKDSIAYRSFGETLKSREEIALVVKASDPLGTILRIIKVDDDLLFKLSGLNDFRNLERTKFLELSAGNHKIVLTVAIGIAGSNSFLVTKQIAVDIYVEAGKEYVLWGDVWKDGSKVGFSKLDEYCMNDYCQSQINDQSRLDNARETTKLIANTYWQFRNKIPTASHY